MILSALNLAGAFAHHSWDTTAKRPFAQRAPLRHPGNHTCGARKPWRAGLNERSIPEGIRPTQSELGGQRRPSGPTSSAWPYARPRLGGRRRLHPVARSEAPVRFAGTGIGRRRRVAGEHLAGTPAGQEHEVTFRSPGGLVALQHLPQPARRQGSLAGQPEALRGASRWASRTPQVAVDEAVLSPNGHPRSCRPLPSTTATCPPTSTSAVRRPTTSSRRIPGSSNSRMIGVSRRSSKLLPAQLASIARSRRRSAPARAARARSAGGRDNRVLVNLGLLERPGDEHRSALWRVWAVDRDGVAAMSARWFDVLAGNPPAGMTLGSWGAIHRRNWASDSSTYWAMVRGERLTAPPRRRFVQIST